MGLCLAAPIKERIEFSLRLLKELYQERYSTLEI